MKRIWIAVACSLSIFGCVPQPMVDQKQPTPVVVSDDAASEYIEHYRSGLSKAASEVATSARSGAYKDMVELNQDWTERTKQARVSAQVVLIEKMNAVKDAEVGDPKVAEMFDKLAAGWNKGEK